MNAFVKTLIGGALGLAALYAVGRVAYQMGHDVAELEHKCESAVQRADEEPKDAENGHEETETPVEEEAKSEPAPSAGKIRMIANLLRRKDRKPSVLGNLIRHPEKHRIEAFMDGETLRVNVRPRTT